MYTLYLNENNKTMNLKRRYIRKFNMNIICLDKK